MVTPGQSPEWLNLEHPKLRLVNQDDIVDREYLPTFNSNAIEMSLHRIPELAENFVYFNDDMMIFAPTEASHFFPNGSPAGFAVMNALSGGDPLSHYLLNNVGVLNRHFDKKTTIRRAWKQWFSPKYGAKNIRNLLLLPWPAFTGFFEPHLPMALRKKTFDELWEKESELLRQTSASKFRALDNLSPFIFRYWQLCSGDFTPVSPSQYGRFYEFGRDDIGEITAAILSGRHRLICVNDGEGQDFASHTVPFRNALEQALPTQSQFEVR
ncbi:hypothetical protein ASC66_09415 [Leifsonia sp. Root4]|nr:hypothetical protein ASC66_09415 [Leifsonia sp. Root4]